MGGEHAARRGGGTGDEDHVLVEVELVCWVHVVLAPLMRMQRTLGAGAAEVVGESSPFGPKGMRAAGAMKTEVRPIADDFARGRP
jgi:hypothetical protein